MKIASKNLNPNFIRGFTLIELMVVIAIIGILAGTVLVFMGGARESARDVRRTAEIDQLFNAMELCYSAGENYPDGTSGGFWTNSSSSEHWENVHSCSTCWKKFLNNLTPCANVSNIIDPINIDPEAYYYFHFGPDCVIYKGLTVSPQCRGHYALMSVLETSKNDNSNAGCFADPDHYTYWRILGL